MASRAVANGGFRRMLWGLSGWNQLGLYHDDILYETPQVKEAIRRLPADEYDQRIYRQLRAVQLTIQQHILPKEEWTKYEDDISKGHYLQSYLDEIQKEEQEKKEWAEKYYE